MSLSARRAWIEIAYFLQVQPQVASLSARRAWIEILSEVFFVSAFDVALRKESVDRNVDPDSDNLTDDGRSPQGERG